MKFRVRQSRAEPAQIGIARVGQGDGAASHKGFAHPGLAQTSFGDSHQVQPARPQKSGHCFGIAAYCLGVYVE
jgi:hypothetical protein